MRITGGTHGGRVLQSPKDRAIRPTSDKVRQALFNILNARHLVQEAVVLDAFCGTGALGLEALSQGALCCSFMDKSRSSLNLAQENFAALKMDGQHYFLLKDAIRPGAKPQTIPSATLVFLDPPYRQGLVAQSLDSLARAGWIAQEAHILTETEISWDCTVLASLGYSIILTRDYGDTRITLAQNRQGVKEAMIYLFAAIGFVLGFAAGLIIISLFLRGYSTKTLTHDKSLRWTYGLAVWVFAALGTLAGVWLFDRSFF